MDYGYEKIEFVPPEMERWGIWLRDSPPTNFGQYVVVGIEPASIESHHQVVVIDENGDPLSGIWVIFGFPGGGGQDIPLQPRRNFWREAPRVLNGNYVATSQDGYAEHTFGEGGEDIWVWSLQDEEIRLSSVIVHNCRWVQARFIHTGVRITFQRRDSSVLPEGDRLEQLEARVSRLEQTLDDLTPGAGTGTGAAGFTMGRD